MSERYYIDFDKKGRLIMKKSRGPLGTLVVDDRINIEVRDSQGKLKKKA